MLASDGSAKSVIFKQDIQPGKQRQAYFTNMNALLIAINQQALKHLLFRFMLPD